MTVPSFKSEGAKFQEGWCQVSRMAVPSFRKGGAKFSQAAVPSFKNGGAKFQG